MPTTVLPTMTSTGRPLDTNAAKRIQPVSFADLPADAALASTTFNARHESIVAPTIDHARGREIEPLAVRPARNQARGSPHAPCLNMCIGPPVWEFAALDVVELAGRRPSFKKRRVEGVPRAAIETWV